MITLTTVAKPQGVSIYVLFIAFTASFIILTDEYFRFSLIGIEPASDNTEVCKHRPSTTVYRGSHQFIIMLIIKSVI